MNRRSILRWLAALPFVPAALAASKAPAWFEDLKPNEWSLPPTPDDVHVYSGVMCSGVMWGNPASFVPRYYLTHDAAYEFDPESQEWRELPPCKYIGGECSCCARQCAQGRDVPGTDAPLQMVGWLVDPPG